MLPHNRFITLEGLEGLGKSSQARYLAQKLRAQGHTVTLTREPGGTRLGEGLRALILNETLDPLSELLLMGAARREHLQSVIRPALHQGHWVICDRFTESTYAYQGGGRGLADHYIATLCDWIQEGLEPGHIILLDGSYALSQQRLSKRQQLDRIELEAAPFFERVRQKYLSRARTLEQVHIIDASQSLRAVNAELTQLLKVWLAA